MLIKADCGFSELIKKIQMKGLQYGKYPAVSRAGRQDVLFNTGLNFNFYIFFLWGKGTKFESFK